MKLQLYMLTAGLLVAGLANAQIKKGDVILGGNLGFNTSTQKSSQSSDETKQNGVTIAPSIGWAIKDNLTMGGYLSFIHSNFDSPNGGSSQTTDGYGLGYFIRKYKMLGSGFALFAEGNLGGSYNHYKNTPSAGSGSAETDSKTYGVNLGFYPGIAYFISRHVMLETGFQNLVYANYGHAKNTATGAPGYTSSSGFAIGTGLSNQLQNFTVGLKWLL